MLLAKAKLPAFNSRADKAAKSSGCALSSDKLPPRSAEAAAARNSPFNNTRPWPAIKLKLPASPVPAADKSSKAPAFNSTLPCSLRALRRPAARSAVKLPIFSLRPATLTRAPDSNTTLSLAWLPTACKLTVPAGRSSRLLTCKVLACSDKLAATAAALEAMLVGGGVVLTLALASVKLPPINHWASAASAARSTGVCKRSAPSNCNTLLPVSKMA
jgi:hypothetical protein